jgi:hypothetical protein
MLDQEKLVGRVIRVGRGWVDVSIDRRVRRVSTRPDLLVKAGSYLQIVNDQGVALLPSSTRHIPTTMQ